MKKFATLPQEDIVNMKKQVKLQKRFLILSPFLIAFLLSIITLRNNGKIAPVFVNIIAVTPLLIGTIYSPIFKGILLGKIFYKVENISGDAIRFTRFGTLWRSEKTITTDLKEMKVDKTPLPNLLYKKYMLNVVYVADKKYYIFNNLLEESGIADD